VGDRADRRHAAERAHLVEVAPVHGQQRARERLGAEL